MNKGQNGRSGSTNVTTPSRYKTNLVTSLKRSSARKTRARKLELCSKNRESVKKTKRLKAPNASDGAYGSDFDRTSLHSDKAGDEDNINSAGVLRPNISKRNGCVGLRTHSLRAQRAQQLTNDHILFCQIC